jgi:DASS family divalent anion:Na+ symporter
MAQIAAMYAGFLGAAIVVGMPPLLATLVLGFASNLFESMTQYGCGPAPILFGSALWTWANNENWICDQGYQLVIWAMVGGIWWKLIGFYSFL